MSDFVQNKRYLSTHPQKIYGLDHSCFKTFTKLLNAKRGKMAEMSEDFLVSENEISSLLLDVDGELEVYVEYDEEELGNFMDEDFVLPELPSIEENRCSLFCARIRRFKIQ